MKEEWHVLKFWLKADFLNDSETHARARQSGTRSAPLATLRGLSSGSLQYQKAQRLCDVQVKIGEIHGRGPDPWGNYRRSGAFTPYTAIVNVTGLPAISLPLYHGDDGLPAGVQLIGRAASEGALLGLATALEAALPWADRRPDL